MKDDDKVISLAKKREEQQRSFGQERDERIKELSELGFSIERATAIADEVALCDWLVFQAVMIADRWDLDREAVPRLVEMMRRLPCLKPEGNGHE